MKEAKTTVKTEPVSPAKRARSQIDRIADAEIVRLECKKERVKAEERRIETLAGLVAAKAQERSQRQRIELEREKMRLEHEYRMAALQVGQVPSQPYTQDSPRYPAGTWSSPGTSTSAPQSFSISQSFPESDSDHIPELTSSQPPIDLKLPPPLSGDLSSGHSDGTTPELGTLSSATY